MRLPVVSFRRFAQLAAALAFSGCAGEAGVMNRGSVDAGTSQDAGVVSTQDAGGAGAVDAGSPGIHLVWDASTSPGVSYTVYRGVASGGPYTARATSLVDLSFADTLLSSGTTYFYVVSAVDAVSESMVSNEVSATAP